ncbi:MAG: SusD/RagB family nutrient-binding outer membrane lipoprotein [Dysgonamonadaceae bacterium]|jgi:tetratricopeptide (TPR) repeat protein|nr:SusD/RagB family nutrient-binding outer membrane lipoprotein [Dysgonamonadaceae bacterium]
MKKIILYISLSLLLSVVSCNDYLNVNEDLDNPTSTSATVNIRLPWIQNYFAYAWGTAGMRANTIAGLLTQTATTSGNGLLAAWNPAQSSCTTIYQNWYVGAAVNIDPMITKAEEEGAYYYAGAGYCIKAMGTMMMLDLHGELPVTEAFTPKYNPTYDDGKAMYDIAMGYLDKAIENLSKPAQESGSTAFAESDIWNGGDVNKWLKLCYGLKARYLLKLSKKADLFDPTAVLAALQNAPQSNNDNTVMKHYNVQGDETNFTVVDPYQTNAFWNCVAYGATQRTTRWYVDLFKANGITDPRLEKMLPASMSNVVLNSSGGILSYDWMRDVGVDMQNSNIRQQGALISAAFAAAADVKITYLMKDVETPVRTQFIADISSGHTVVVTGDTVKVTYKKGQLYCQSTDYRRAGDTVYVNMRANSMSTSGRGVNDMFYYPTAGYDYVAGTGVFYARPNSDSDFLTYAEMCFIKAEVYLRQGNSQQALAAYKDGVKAHFDRMQVKLREWEAAGTKNPDELPMNDADITAYLSSAGICQNAGDLTMAEIIRQKIIALGFDYEIWNDMRRFNYSAGNVGTFGVVYPGYKRPYEFTATNKIVGTSPADLTYWFRRFSQSTHESNYNNTQLMASNKLAMTDPIWSCPIWWDCATDDEYYGYIK